MIELGLGLLATCLPTLRFLFKNYSFDILLSSIRGVFSIRSFRSQQSSSLTDTYRNAHGYESTESHAKIIGVGVTGDNRAEVYALGPFKDDNDAHLVEPGQIVVDTNFGLSRTPV